MYPTTKSEEYYPQATAPSVTTGFPVGSAGQFYGQMGPSAAFGVRAQTTVPWSTGLCDCSDDCGNCCITCCCPCITFGQVAEIVDRGSTSCGTSGALYSLLAMVTGLPCLYSCFYRSKMRGDYSLQQSSCPDCLVHFCCECCALCQMYRELKNRGFDMDIGWHANMEKRGAMAPPGVPGGMNRY